LGFGRNTEGFGVVADKNIAVVLPNWFVVLGFCRNADAVCVVVNAIGVANLSFGRAVVLNIVVVLILVLRW
jgi:hypothetical protein